MAQTLKPFVYWGQSKDRVFLKVELSGITAGPDIYLEKDCVDFKAHGVGAQGKHLYSFHLDFYLDIDEKLSKYKVTGRAVEFELYKVGAGEVWPRLTESVQKLSWLKTDFDRIAFNDSDNSSDDEDDAQINRHVQNMTEKEMLDSLDKEFKETQFQAIHDLKTYYLFLYNMFQWVGFTYIFLTLVYHCAKFGADAHKNAFALVGPALMVCQLTAVLEVVHSLLGWVRTNTFTAFIQMGGRSMVLFGLIAFEPALQTKESTMWLFIIWSSVEIVRYPYYMLNIINREISFLTWLRYTTWIPLYPAGFILEGITILLALPVFDRSNMWSIGLPNASNFSFHFPTFLRIYMLIFIPGMYFLMQRMYEQRKKKIAPTVARARIAKKTS